MGRILVVDDEAGVRAFLAGALEADGHQVTQAEDGEAALACLRQQAFHVLVTDLKMPRLDGMALLRRTRAERPETEVIVLTAHGAVESAVEAMKLGACEYLQKPLASPAELRLLVQRALERHELQALRDRSRQDAEDALPLGYGDAAMAPVEEALRKVARTNSTVLLCGESGTGKEVAARLLHRLSERAERPFVAVNCAALPEQLLESELFGHEKGAFTGAVQRRRGRLELADGGTFFLDEVAELRPELQAKLLRVLQERSFERLGGTQTIAIDVRWVAATNRDLRALMDAGSFRADLYHRLAVFPIELPPLRERRADILPLATALLRRLARQVGCAPPPISAAAQQLLLAGEWRGNVRELANALERALILCDGRPIEPAHLRLDAAGARPAGAAPQSLAELERDAILAALSRVAGNRRAAAEQLGIGLRTLYEKLKRYGVE
ncbi:MAG: sigma-54 dependent transcriptional regulator [Deltaproteobacteria bacterium]|nr:sigma-54 dependent transcriptional regulator [Deltaproteobacteria bacterium]